MERSPAAAAQFSLLTGLCDQQVSNYHRGSHESDLVDCADASQLFASLLCELLTWFLCPLLFHNDSLCFFHTLRQAALSVSH